jgi:hypothetical protein
MRLALQKLAISMSAAVSLGALPHSGFAQITSNSASVALTATLPESLTISATPSSVSFTLHPSSTSTASAPIAITTTWNTSTVEGNLALDAYFASTTAALSYAGPPVVNIPSSAVLGQVATGLPTSYTTFTQTGHVTSATASATLELFNVTLTSANRSGTRSDNLALEINLASLPQIPAATYTGTLVLLAQAY